MPKSTRYYISPYIILPLIFAGFSILAAVVALQLPSWYSSWQAGARWGILLWTAVIGLGAFGCGLLVVRFLLRPIEELVQQAERLPTVSAGAAQQAANRNQDELSHYSAVFEQVAHVLSRMEARELFPEMVGQSKSIRGVLSQIMKVAPTDSTVLITGESGTGKELVASAIHRLCGRKDKPFVKLNCVAIPEGLLESELFGHEKGAFTGATGRKAGKFEQANGGTILLDEIGDMPLNTQAKILRVLQEREFERVGGNQSIRVDVRVLASTNRDLAALIREGGFREDLFFRLNVFCLDLPPLRQRKEDLPLLVDHFLENTPGKPQFASPALQMLMAYAWPGNVRELQNAVERSAVLCENGLVETHHLPAHITRGLPYRPVMEEAPRPVSVDEQLREIEKGIILEALRKSGGIQVRAAELLGIKERSLWHRIKKYDIDVQIVRSSSN